MTRKLSSPLWHWGDGPEWEKPEETPEEEAESKAERMRRLNAAFAADYEHLFNKIFGDRC